MRFYTVRSIVTAKMSFSPHSSSPPSRPRVASVGKGRRYRKGVCADCGVQKELRTVPSCTQMHVTGVMCHSKKICVDPCEYLCDSCSEVVYVKQPPSTHFYYKSIVCAHCHETFDSNVLYDGDWNEDCKESCGGVHSPLDDESFVVQSSVNPDGSTTPYGFPDDGPETATAVPLLAPHPFSVPPADVKDDTVAKKQHSTRVDFACVAKKVLSRKLTQPKGSEGPGG